MILEINRPNKNQGYTPAILKYCFFSSISGQISFSMDILFSTKEKLSSIVSSWWCSVLILIVLVISYRQRKARNSKEKIRPGRRGINRGQAYPRQYPAGWYRVCDSDEIRQRGQIKHIVALGREMVAFRSDDDQEKVYVVDAYCPHMGANLAFGGRVMPGSNCIQCPFHLWEFNGETGRCSKIPYIDGKIPEKVR